MSASSPTEPARSRDESDALEPSGSTPVQGDQSRRTWAAPGASGVTQESAGPSATEHDAETSEDPMRHRLLARIPGLSRLAEQSGWVEGSGQPPTEDQGWAFHEGDGGEAFEGWLYHYADGTMVDADGVEYAFPDDSSSPEPTAEPEAEPEAAAPEAEAEPEAQPEPEPEPVADEVQPEEPPAEDDHPRPELALVEDRTDEPVEDETEEQAEEPAEDTAEPPAEEQAEEQAQESTASVVGPEPEDEAEPGDEAAPEDEAAREAEVEPDTQPEPQSETQPEPEPALPAGVPRFVEYSPTHVRGYLLGGVFVLASVAAVLTLFVAVSESSVAALVIAAGCVVLGVVAWWALLAWRPTVVSIREGVLDITRGGHTETFELADPSTSVEFSGKPGSPTWTAVVRSKNGPRTILKSSHVKPRQFERIVRHHRAPATGEVTPD